MTDKTFLQISSPTSPPVHFLTVNQDGEAILVVPASALRTFQTVPKSIKNSLRDITVQGLLAADLSMDDSETRAQWRAIFPSRDDFTEIMPLMWPSPLQSLLTPDAKLLLENQKKKLSTDWATVSCGFPDLTYDLYRYNWLIVSTRTFYFTSPKMKIKKPVKHDDCLALCPFADLCNHADIGCEVTFGPSGYKISAYRDIDEGEEICISYGNHSNDFLLVEYGFILVQNKWDQVCLDDVLIPLFSEDQKQALRQEGFLGKFILDKQAVCYRTQVALRLLCIPVNRWQVVVTKGVEEGDKYQEIVDGILHNALRTHLEHIDVQIQEVEAFTSGLSSQMQTLSARWKQVRLLLTISIDRIESKTTSKSS